jgi:hypothetical protein
MIGAMSSAKFGSDSNFGGTMAEIAKIRIEEIPGM